MQQVRRDGGEAPPLSSALWVGLVRMGQRGFGLMVFQERECWCGFRRWLYARVCEAVDGRWEMGDRS